MHVVMKKVLVGMLSRPASRNVGMQTDGARNVGMQTDGAPVTTEAEIDAVMTPLASFDEGDLIANKVLSMIKPVTRDAAVNTGGLTMEDIRVLNPTPPFLLAPPGSTPPWLANPRRTPQAHAPESPAVISHELADWMNSYHSEHRV